MFVKLFLLIQFLILVSSQQYVVQTNHGLVQGYFTNNHITWRGIPFAKPPVGSLRWTNPQPPNNWTGVYNATYYRSSCTQGPLAMKSDSEGEDCLYLNVYAPKNYQENIGKIPVMLWFYGGAFVTGSASLVYFDGGYFANTTNTILVTTNYRLGIFGYLTGSTLRGNYGIRDQIAAMQWVQDNIEGFGGDKNQVTIFGQSAGAMSTTLQLTIPMSNGLFNRAIIESNPFGVNYNPIQDYEPRFKQVAAELGCLLNRDIVSCMRSKSSEELSKVQENTFWIPSNLPHYLPPNGTILRTVLQWPPVIDGELITDSPFNLINQGKINKNTGVVIGHVRDCLNSVVETLFSKQDDVLTDFDYRSAVYFLFPNFTDQLLEQYPYNSSGNNIYNFGRLVSDWVFICPTRKAASAFANNSVNTYLYHWMYRPIFDPFNLGSKMCSNGKGACHSTELNYIFRSGWFNSPEEEQLSVKAMKLWTDFAHSNDLVVDNVTWKSYSPKTGTMYGMEIDVPTFNLVDEYSFERCNIFDKVINMDGK